MFKVQIVENNELKQEIEVAKLMDVSTAQFAVLKHFNDSDFVHQVEELLVDNDELKRRNEELEEKLDEIDAVLQGYGFDDIEDMEKAYNDACTALSDIYDMTREYA